MIEHSEKYVVYLSSLSSVYGVPRGTLQASDLRYFSNSTERRGTFSGFFPGGLTIFPARTSLIPFGLSKGLSRHEKKAIGCNQKEELSYG